MPPGNRRSQTYEKYLGPNCRPPVRSGRHRQSFSPRGVMPGGDGLRASDNSGNIQQYEILVRLPRAQVAISCKQPNRIGEYSAVPDAPRCPRFNDAHGGQRANRTVRAVIPRLVWKSGSRGSITSVNVPQAVPPSVVRESVWRFSRRQMPDILPGGGRM